MGMDRRTLLATGLALPFLRLPRAVAQPGAQPAPQPGAVTRSHALSLLGEPSLPPDFTHWPWVNPDAPKGGEIALTALGSFDTFNGYVLRGTPAVGLINLYDTLLKSSSDEASTEYSHLAAVIEQPADGMGVTFELPRAGPLP